MNRIVIPDHILKEIQTRYKAETKATIPSLAKEYGYQHGLLYRRLKDTGFKLYKKGWNDDWQGEKVIYGVNKRNKIKCKYRRRIVSAMLPKQNFECAICFDPINLETAHLDHCHANFSLRSLLCHRCNLGLGFFRDNTKYLDSAKSYLLAHRPKKRFSFLLRKEGRRD